MTKLWLPELIQLMAWGLKERTFMVCQCECVRIVNEVPERKTTKIYGWIRWRIRSNWNVSIKSCIGLRWERIRERRNRIAVNEEKQAERRSFCCVDSQTHRLWVCVYCWHRDFEWKESADPDAEQPLYKTVCLWVRKRRTGSALWGRHTYTIHHTQVENCLSISPHVLFCVLC